MRQVRAPVRLLLAAGLLLAVGSCGFDPAGDVPMDAPGIYQEWWAKTEACSGIHGNFDRLRWSVIDGNSFPCSSGQCAGHWNSDHHIFLASDWVMNEMVVRHEMLHDLIGQPGHPAPPFGEGCPLTWQTWNGGVEQLSVKRRQEIPARVD